MLNSYFSAQESQIKPACIVLPQTTADIVTVVAYFIQANQLNGIDFLKFASRIGGNTCSAGSAKLTDGMPIDHRGLKSIEVDQGSLQVPIGTGES